MGPQLEWEHYDDGYTEANAQVGPFHVTYVGEIDPEKPYPHLLRVKVKGKRSLFKGTRDFLLSFNTEEQVDRFYSLNPVIPELGPEEEYYRYEAGLGRVTTLDELCLLVNLDFSHIVMRVNAVYEETNPILPTGTLRGYDDQ